MNFFIRKWIKQKNISDHIPTVVANLFRFLRLPATRTLIRKTLKNHPDFPNLLSIAESLKEWGVRTEAVKGTVIDLSEADYPGIAHLKSNEFVVLEEIRDGHVRILNSKTGYTSYSLKSFGDIWSGVILRVIPGKNTGERDYLLNRRKEIFSSFLKYLGLMGVPILLVLSFYIVLQGLENIGGLLSLAAAKALGLVLCSIMVSNTLGNTTLIQNICPMGKRLNCHRVMNSPAGRIFGISMAEVGLLYFSGGLLTILFSLFLKQVELNLLFLTLLNVLSLPYTFFSIAYQAFVVRSWCWMCVVVQVLFWVEFYFLYGYIFGGINDLSWRFPISIVMGFSLTAFFWIILRYFFTSATKMQKLLMENLRLRRNADYIRMRLAGLKKVDMGHFPFEVEIGTKNAPVNITLVVNPLCGYCWKAYGQLEKLIELCESKLKGSIRFFVPVEDQVKTETEKSLDCELSKHIAALAKVANRDEMRRALSEWFTPKQGFSKSKFVKWRRKYFMGEHVNKGVAEEIIKGHREWALSLKIDATPTMFLNDLQLPQGIQIEDLKFFLMRQLRK